MYTILSVFRSRRECWMIKFYLARIQQWKLHGLRKSLEKMQKISFHWEKKIYHHCFLGLFGAIESRKQRINEVLKILQHSVVFVLVSSKNINMAIDCWQNGEKMRSGLNFFFFSECKAEVGETQWRTNMPGAVLIEGSKTQRQIWSMTCTYRLRIFTLIVVGEFLCSCPRVRTVERPCSEVWRLSQSVDFARVGEASSLDNSKRMMSSMVNYWRAKSDR